MLHVISLVVLLQTIRILPLLNQDNLIGVRNSFKILVADTAMLKPAQSHHVTHQFEGISL